MITEREKILAIVDNDCLSTSDAIILLEGDGFDRFRKAVSLYKQGKAPKIVFSGNITDYDYGSYPFEEVLPRMLEEGVPEMAQERGWKKLILVASHEHQYRAYLTFLREVLDSKSGITLYNAPARNLDWFVDKGWGTRFERLEAEILRIEKYTEMGHLANAQEVIDYQKWKEAQLTD